MMFVFRKMSRSLKLNFFTIFYVYPVTDNIKNFEKYIIFLTTSLPLIKNTILKQWIDTTEAIPETNHIRVINMIRLPGLTDISKLPRCNQIIITSLRIGHYTHFFLLSKLKSLDCRYCLTNFLFFVHILEQCPIQVILTYIITF